MCMCVLHVSVNVYVCYMLHACVFVCARVCTYVCMCFYGRTCDMLRTMLAGCSAEVL